MDARKPTYDQLSALCAQMAAALEDLQEDLAKVDPLRFDTAYPGVKSSRAALTAYRTLSPDPQWQRVPVGWVVVPEYPSADMVKAVAKLKVARILAKGDGKGIDNGIIEEWQLMVSLANRARGEG